MVAKDLPNKYTVLTVAIISTFMLWFTFNEYNPAGMQPVTIFGALTILSWFSVLLVFTHKKLWDKAHG